MTDADFMLRVLQDGEAHSTMDLIQRSIAERGHGLTPHSRAASLRERGHIVACHRIPGPRGFRERATYVYKLISAPLNAVAVLPGEGHVVPSSATETAAATALSGARSSGDLVAESAPPRKLVSPPLPSPTTPASIAAAAVLPETSSALSLFDVPEVPAWG